MHHILKDLNRVIAENKVLLAPYETVSESAESLQGERLISFDASGNSFVPHENDFSPQSFAFTGLGARSITQVRTAPEDNRESTSVSVSKSLAPVTKSEIALLNDSLRANGIAAIPRGSDMHDALAGAVSAIEELASRNRELLNSTTLNASMHGRNNSSFPVQNRRSQGTCTDRLIDSASCATFAETSVPVSEYNQLVEENKRISQLALRFKSEAASAGRSLKVKESELERLQLRLQSKYREEDQRTALAVTTVRDHNMPQSSVLVVNNYQKQISMLEKENESLTKRNTSFANRVKMLEEDRVRLHELVKECAMDGGVSSKEAQRTQQLLRDEVVELNEKSKMLESVIEEKTSDAKRWELKYYQLVEQRNLEKRKLSSTRFAEELCAVVGVDTPDSAIQKVKDMQTVLTETLVDFENFFNVVKNRLSSENADIHAGLNWKNVRLGKDFEIVLNKLERLKLSASELHNIECLMTQIAETGTALVDADSVVDKIKSLHKLSQSEPVRDAHRFHEFNWIVCELESVLDCRSSADIVSVVNSMVFKIREFSNFYTQLCECLAIPKGSYQKCIDAIDRISRKDVPDLPLVSRKKGVQHSKHLDHNHDDDLSPVSDVSSVVNLALSREIIKVPRV